MTKLLALGLVLAGTTLGHADVRPMCDDAPQQVKFHVEMIDGRPTTVIDSSIVICDKIPRPSVFYVMQAKHITYAWEKLEPLDFMPLVLSTVTKAPF